MLPMLVSNILPEIVDDYFRNSIPLKKKKELIKTYNRPDDLPVGPPNLNIGDKSHGPVTFARDKELSAIQRNMLDVLLPITKLAEDVLEFADISDEAVATIFQDLKEIVWFITYAQESVTILRNQNIARKYGGQEAAKSFVRKEDSENVLFTSKMLEDIKKARKVAKLVKPQPRANYNPRFHGNNRFSNRRNDSSHLNGPRFQGRQRGGSNPSYQPRTFNKTPQNRWNNRS